MVGEVAGKKLYEAAAKGDASTFEELVQENPDVLDGVWFACWNRSPLHVATMQGNAEIVESMLRRNPQLAEELDSQKSSPLHIAAAKGYVRIASKLLSEAPHMCWLRDCHGMNPVHIAAMNGHVEILKEMIRLDPFPAREKLDHGQNVMHLCVKHRQFEELKSLADNHNLSELVNEGDDNGDTVLHLAARYKLDEIIEYLVGINKIDKKSRNAKGKTPLQIWSESLDPATAIESLDPATTSPDPATAIESLDPATTSPDPATAIESLDPATAIESLDPATTSPDPATASESPATHSQIREILKYDSTTLDKFLQENQHLLISNRSPLHVATMQGNAEIVEIMLRIHPQLAEELDSQKSSPLHIAAAKGHVEIASRLRPAAEHMCWSRDCHGMNPIHVAAMNGHIQILKGLVELDHFPAMEKLDRGNTVLHLCVKHRRLTELQFLVGILGDLVHSKNDDGETILHLAARYEQVEMIRFLVESTKIDKHSRNTMGRTALEILKASPGYTTSSYSDIKVIMGRRTGFLQVKELIFLDNMSEAIMVVAVLIAAMAFQATISPPGGVWQEDSSTHKAGEAVMASSHPTQYIRFINQNTVAFICSFLTIIQLLFRRTSEPFLIIYTILFSVLMSIAYIIMCYLRSITVITPAEIVQSGVLTNLKIAIVLAMGSIVVSCGPGFVGNIVFNYML